MRDQLIYALEWRPGYAKGFESGLNVTSLLRRQRPMRALVQFTLACAATCVEHNFWAIHCSQPAVQVDRLVSYPLVFIHLRYHQALNA